MVKKTRFTLIHSADFMAYKKEHVTLTPEEEIINAKQKITWPLNCFAVLVQHPTLGNILYDTGIDDGWEYRWPRNLAEEYPVSKSYNFKESLRKLGLGVDDIDILILSHMHFDHAGNVRLFRGTKAGQNIIISEDEAKGGFVAAGKNDCAKIEYRYDGYVRHEYCGLDGIAYKIIPGDMKLADDVELIMLPGHTMGTLGLVVRTEKTGTAIFPSDAIYNSTNYGPPAVFPGMCARPNEYGNSIEKVRKIAESENGQVFFSHDVATFKTYKTAPEWYE